MKIGITFDLKSAAPASADAAEDAEEEFDSPQTIDAIARVLTGLGHQVVRLGDGPEFLDRVRADKPDFVFNFAEGQGISRAREARVPAVLEMLSIPYSGSDPFTLAVTLDKDCAKTLAARAGIAVPDSFALEHATPFDAVPLDRLKFPLVVKPAWEGSSKGIRRSSLVTHPDEVAPVVAALRRGHRQTLLLEEYIAGEEVTVGLLGNAIPRILGIMHIQPNDRSEPFLYSLDIKREYKKRVTYHSPPALPAATLQAIEKSARTAFRVLDCRDVARVDFRVRDGVPYFLEVNPLPGLHPDDSDLVILARLVGWSHEKLVSSILQEALQRCGR